MTGRRIPWYYLRAGDLFQSRDDMYPLKVVEVLKDSVVVRQSFRVWRVYFRAGARVIRYD